MISWASLYLSELPYIVSITLAVYLAFEHWRFPDLTIESSFTTGMVLTYIAMTGHHVNAIVAVALLIPFAALSYALVTWTLTLLRMPPLFAGLLVVLGGYSVNFLLNGSSITQSGFLPRETTLSAYLGLPVLDIAFMSAIGSAIFLSAVVAIFDNLGIGRKIFLARRIPDRGVVKALGISPSLMLLVSMFIYNLIALMGGTGLAFCSDLAGVTFLGAIAPGLACMFIIKAVRDYASVPSKRALSLRASMTSYWILKRTDSLWFVVCVLTCLALVLTLVRFWLREVGISLGMLNAWTAIGTFVLWGTISGLALLGGKELKGRIDGI